MPDASPDRLTPVQKLTNITGWTIAGNLIVAFILVFVLAGRYASIEKEAYSSASNLSQALANDIDSTYELIEATLALTADDIGKADVLNDASRSHKLLKRSLGLLGNHVSMLACFDQKGLLLRGVGDNLKTGTSIADRRYFQSLRDNPMNPFAIEGPLLLRGKQEVHGMVLAHRISAPDGRFLGTLITSMRNTLIEKQVRSLDLAPGSVVFVRNAAMETIIRFPAHPNAQPGSKVLFPEFVEALKLRPEKGTYRAVATQVDGIDRLFAYQNNSRFGISVTVGVAADEVFGGWLRTVILIGCAFAACVPLTLWLAVRLDRSWEMSNRQLLEISLSNQELAAIVETTKDGFWRVAASGRLVDVNENYCTMSGYSRDELLSLNISDLDANMTPEVIALRIDEVLASGFGRFETRHRRKDGSIFDVEVSATHSVANNLFMVFIHDISGRKRIDQMLATHRAQLQQFLDHLPGTAYMKDEESRVVLANRGFKSMFGLDPDKITGMRSDELFPGELGQKILADDARILQTGTAETIEESHDGRFYESTKFAIANGDRKFLGGITVDSTNAVRNRMRTEALLTLANAQGKQDEKEFLRLGLELAESLTASKIGFLHFVNEDQETIELVTWTAGALKGCQATYDNHYPISAAGIWADCFRHKRAVVFNDYPNYAGKQGLPAGHAPLERLISVPVIEEGEVRMMMGVGNKPGNYDDFDIESVQLIGNDLWRIVRRSRAEAALMTRFNEINELNAKLSQAQAQLLQSEKMSSIGQLAAGVAHELNNPIGFVSSNLGTLDTYLSDLFLILDAYAETEGSIPETDKHFGHVRTLKLDKDYDFLRSDLLQLVAESRDGLARAAKIIRDLKDFSRAGEAQMQWADLHQGLDSTLNVVWNELKYKCEVRKEYGEIPQIWCEASQINQIFMNLLVNAGQAIANRGTITIRTGVKEDKAFVAISDTGIGIPPENIERIFDPFFTTKPVGKGTGLGLSLAYGIAQKHQGSITVDSTPGAGTTFTLWLPLHPTDAVPPET